MEKEHVWTDEKGLIHYQKITYIDDVATENKELQQNGSNGFTKERTMRHVGQIPAQVYHRWATKIGFYQMDKQQKRIEMWRFLNDHPEWRTVDSLVHHTRGEGHLIVK